MAMQELGRIVEPSNGTIKGFTLDPGAETVIIENALSVVLLCAYGRNPTADDWDFAVPGSCLFMIPKLGGQNRLFCLVSSAPPAADVMAILWQTDCRWPAFVGPIA